jgi:NAD(P)-dependent dehydrogenase (short-subunit alcohol dehydrogenase family)
MTKFKDNCVLITGGGSGIGRIMGRMALEKGAKCLVIWDINEANMEATKQELSALAKECFEMGKQIGMAIYMQHEDIFNAMHSI